GEMHLTERQGAVAVVFEDVGNVVVDGVDTRVLAGDGGGCRAYENAIVCLSLINIYDPTRNAPLSRMTSSA
ncbi:hypothetical protein, partial [Enterobacter hormaechei]